jgi:hypothetical protein
VVGEPVDGLPAGAPQPGDRAPDARGLRRDIARYPVRLFELLAGTGHTVLLYADTAAAAAGLDGAAAAARGSAREPLAVYAVLADGVAAPDLQTPAVRDVEGGFRAAYSATGGTAVVVRPDGYVGHRGPAADLGGYFARVFAGAPREREPQLTG